MKQVTLRLDDVLAARLKAAAAERGTSVNALAEMTLGAVVDPDLAGDEIDRLRERLARAGLLEVPTGDVPAPVDQAEFEAARAAAGRGQKLSDIVSEGRG